MMECVYESLSVANIKHLVFKEHKTESVCTEEIKRDIVRKTSHSLVSLNFEIENIVHRTDEAGVYHCAEFVYNLLAAHEFPQLERIGLRFDSVVSASRYRFLDLFIYGQQFPNLKQIELLNVTYNFANKDELLLI